MHPEARHYAELAVRKHGPFLRVAEFGSYNVNGGVRDLFGEAFYVGIDLKDGPGVDIVSDVMLVALDEFDCVISTELLEHHPEPWRIVNKAAASLRKGGVFIMTCAGPLRDPHGADGGAVQPGEHYKNIRPGLLGEWLRKAGFSEYDVDCTGIDVRCWAVR